MTRTFSTTTADADPGNGLLRLNNATQNTATSAFIDLLDLASVDQTTLLDALDDSTNTAKGYVRIEKQSDSTAYLLGLLTAVTSATGYRKLVFSVVDSSAANPFANGDALFVTANRAGDVGAVGATGPTGTVATAGANTQVIFNDAGVLAGDAGATYNKTTDALTLAGPLVIGGGASIVKVLTGTATWDPASIGAAATDFTTVTVTGAAVGDPAFASFSTMTAANWLISAHVTATDTVRVVLYNGTAAGINLVSGTVRAVVFKM